MTLQLDLFRDAMIRDGFPGVPRFPGKTCSIHCENFRYFEYAPGKSSYPTGKCLAKSYLIFNPIIGHECLATLFPCEVSA